MTANRSHQDFWALTPLIYCHVHPYGDFNLDMEERLPIEIKELMN